MYVEAFRSGSEKIYECNQYTIELPRDKPNITVTTYVSLISMWLKSHCADDWNLTAFTDETDIFRTKMLKVTISFQNKKDLIFFKLCFIPKLVH